MLCLKFISLLKKHPINYTHRYRHILNLLNINESDITATVRVVDNNTDYLAFTKSKNLDKPIKLPLNLTDCIESMKNTQIQIIFFKEPCKIIVFYNTQHIPTEIHTEKIIYTPGNDLIQLKVADDRVFLNLPSNNLIRTVYRGEELYIKASTGYIFKIFKGLPFDYYRQISGH